MSILQTALLSILPVVNRFTFGEQSLIEKLLQRIFKERPTFSRYTVTYDVKYVLQSFHNVLRLFDVLPNFSFPASETMCDYHL